MKCLDKRHESIVKDNEAAKSHSDNENHTKTFSSWPPFSLPIFPSLQESVGVLSLEALSVPINAHNDCLPRHMCFYCLQRENPMLFLSITFQK